MDKKLLERAKALSLKHYDVSVEQDKLSDGSPIFMASTPELEGCKSQGRTIEDAIRNLADARVDYIYDLLEDGLSVPVPNSENTSTGATPDAFAIYEVDFSFELEFEDVLNTVIRPASRVPLYQALLKT